LRIEIAAALETIVTIEIIQHRFPPLSPKETIGKSSGLFRASGWARIERGWLARHESGTFVRFTQAGSELFA